MLAIAKHPKAMANFPNSALVLPIAMALHRHSLRLLKVVNTLLDFSPIETGRIQAVYEQTDLATFTDELASVFRSAFENAGLRLVVDCPPLPELVYVNRDMWEKIVLNLLSNPFQFTLIGEIAVSLHSSSEEVVRLVQDTGTGIPSEEIPHLFERYHQVLCDRDRIPEGTGIAPAIPCGLIIYELVSTVLKHAFTNGLEEIIKVAFSSENPKYYTLLVRNSAVINRDFDLIVSVC